MSVTASAKTRRYAPSDRTDGIVLAVLAFVCFSGMWLTAPASIAPAPLPDAPLIDGSDPLDAGIVPDPAPTLPAPAEPDPAPTPEATVPTVPAIKPPADIDVPSVKPDSLQQDNTLRAITPRALAELSSGEQIASGAGFISLMGTNYDPTNWHRSTHKATSDFLATDWASDYAIYDADGLSLKIEPASDRPDHFIGGEIQTSGRYGYGRYEVLMRPAKATGTVSSFFTYTGPYHGDPHDEIDIEFLGADTTKIYLNYFKNGGVGEDQTITLPFDAGDALHLYAFEWHRDGITWFVDGVPIHQTREGDPRIPQTPGAMIVNLWTGKPRLYSWHGEPDFSETQADYACISFQPLGSTGRSCSTIFPPEPAAPVRRPNIFVRAFGELVEKLPISQDAPTQIN